MSLVKKRRRSEFGMGIKIPLWNSWYKVSILHVIEFTLIFDVVIQFVEFCLEFIFFQLGITLLQTLNLRCIESWSISTLVVITKTYDSVVVPNQGCFGCYYENQEI